MISREQAVNAVSINKLYPGNKLLCHRDLVTIPREQALTLPRFIIYTREQALTLPRFIIYTPRKSCECCRDIYIIPQEQALTVLRFINYTPGTSSYSAEIYKLYPGASCNAA